MKKYYLAYGSNLNVRQMALRCPTAKPVGSAVIKDYELLFKGSKTGAYLTIEPKSGAEVPVAVWSVELAGLMCTRVSRLSITRPNLICL